MMVRGTKAEQAVAQMLIDRYGVKVWRPRWPDFVMEWSDGSWSMVEAKLNAYDRPRRSQIDSFAFFARMGGHVLVVTETGLLYRVSADGRLEGLSCFRDGVSTKELLIASNLINRGIPQTGSAA